MNPVELYFVSQEFGFLRVRWAGNKIQDVNDYIINAIVVFNVEVPAYWGVWIRFFNSEKVFSHAVHKSPFGLAYILFATRFATDAIYDVIAFAIDIMFGYIMSTSCFACYSP